MRATLESGSIVSHYRILAPIGAGGMGDVYKAHDLTLERTVALKILPAHLVRNDERVRRFVQEAKAASSLNHPHIVTIHEIGEASTAPGDDAKPIQYIAMELIDGKTLKQKLEDPEIELRTLLGYLAQVAEGLAKAHAANIVHRDLKPENVMVTRDGYAKVLDFGLAKLVIKKSVSDSQITLARNDTREGTLVGTVAYMSPEQVRGKPADHRSDIFAFGSMLYEVCTRQRPFEADSDLDVMHRIVHDKPTPIDELNPKVPAEVRRMVRRCMAKEPDKRYHSMKDVALQLSEIVDEFDQLSASAASITGPIPVQRPRRRWWWLAVAAAVLAVAAIVVWMLRRQQSSDVAFTSMKVQMMTTTGDIQTASMSLDARYLAYVTGDNTLWVRQIATGTDVRIVGPLANSFGSAVFSADGNYLYYTLRERVEGASYLWLYVIPSLGGTPRKLIMDVDTPAVGSPDGTRLAFIRGDPPRRANYVMLANTDGSEERKLATLRRFGAPRGVAWSPDGTKLITPFEEMVPERRAFAYEIDVATGQGRKIGGPWPRILDVAWLPDSSAILMSATDRQSGHFQLWLQPYPAGVPVRVTNDSSDYSVAMVTRDGKSISAVQIQWESELVVDGKPFTRLSNQLPITVSAARNGAVVCVLLTDAASNVAILDGPGAAPRFLTTDGVSRDAAISADGQIVVFASDAGGRGAHVFAIGADGSFRRQVTDGKGEAWPRVSGDGRTLIYTTPDDASLWTKPLGGGTPRKLAERLFGNAAISADGKQVVFQQWPEHANVSSVAQLKVVPLDGGAPLLNVPGGVGGLYRFHPNGEALSFTRTKGAGNIWTMPLRGGAQTQVTSFQEGNINGYDWLPDGKPVICRSRVRTNIVLITDFRR